MKAVMTTQFAGRNTLRALGKRRLFRRACTECDYRSEWFEAHADLSNHKYCPRGCEEEPGVPLNIDFARRAN